MSLHADLPPAGAGLPRVLTLDGQWDFLPSARPEPPNPPNADAAWQTIRVPGNWYPQGYAHQGYAWYRLQFQQSAPAGAVSTLTFNGVDYFAEVWLNGQYLGGHEGYFQRFAFDASPALQDGENTLLVRVDSPQEKPEDFSLRKRLLKGIFAHHDTRPGGAWSARGQEGNTGGIWGSVSLKQSLPVQLAVGSVQVQPVKGLESWRVRLDLSLLGELPESAQLEWSLEPITTAADKGQAGEGGSEPGMAAYGGVLVPADPVAGSRQPMVFDLPVDKPTLWYPHGYGTPQLYRLRLQAVQEGQVLDQLEYPLGFRLLEKGADGIWQVNGQRLLLKGTNYIAHQWLGEMDSAGFRRDIGLMLAAHINTVRVHAHVTAAEFYRLCDELGLMVWQDFPLQWGYQDTKVFHATALAQVQDMVRQFGHHPSLIQWTLHNEPPWDADWMQWKYKGEYDPAQNRELDQSLYAVVQALDQTRPTEMLSRTKEHPWFGWYSGHWLDYAKPTRQHTISEFGAQALPDKTSLARILGETPRLPQTDADWAKWVYHNFQRKENLETAQVVMGADIGEFIKNSQQYQARLIQLAAESYRRQAYQPVGALFQFMLVENWPSMNWGVLDFWRNPKPGYVALQRAYQPVLPSLAWDKVVYPAGEAAAVGVWALNDSFVAYPQAQYRIDLYRDNVRLAGKQWVLDVGADMHQQLATYPLPTEQPGEYRLLAELRSQDGQLLGDNEYRFAVLPAP